MIDRFRAPLFVAASCAAVLALAGCGGSSGPSAPDGGSPTPTPAPTPVPTPSVSPIPSVPVACQMTAPSVDCSTRDRKPQDLAESVQAAIDAAVGTHGVMYADSPNRIYDLDLFRSRMVDSLAAVGICGAWDYGNELGDELYVRSKDGCVTEQYDIITGAGGVRVPNKGSMAWQEGWGVPVPAPKPQFSKEGDLSCSLPGDRSTFCFTIKGTHGAYGSQVYKALREVMSENPQLFDPTDYVPGQGEFIPDQLRVAAWRINNQDAYIAAVERKLRAGGLCAYIEKGDILKVKGGATGNIFHDEMDVVQNPPFGGSYVSLAIKDRCHNAGF